MPAASRSPWPRRAALLLAAFCLLGLFSTEVGDTDFWWHLKTGEYIVQRHSLPVPDPFSYTSQLGAGAYPGEAQVQYFNLTHEWLAQALWYVVYRLGGFPGVVLFKALLLSAFCGVAGLLAARRTKSFYWGLFAALAAASVAMLFSADRPGLVTFLMVAVFVWLLERGGPLWLLPVLSLVWANTHGGFFLGWVVLGVYAAAATVNARLKRPCEEPGVEPRRLWLVTGVSVLASGLNPNFFRVVQILAAYRKSAMQQGLVEWTRPPLWGQPYTFAVLLYAAALVMLLAWRRVRVADWLLFAAFAAASLTAFRNIMLTALAAPVLIASYFPWQKKLPAVADLAVPVVLAAALGVGISHGSFFGLRAAEWKFPAGAADFLLARKILTPIFNTYEYGGYLIWRLWPQERVFIDGRALNEAVYKDYIQILGNASRERRTQLLDHYGVEAIVVNAFEYTSGVLYPLILALADPSQTDWQLVYQDPAAMVFLRHPPPDLHPLDKALIAEHLEAECRLHVEKDPELCLCARTLGFLFLRNGDATRARRSFALYFTNNREQDPDAEAAYRRLMGR